MAKGTITQTFTKGLNSDASAYALDPSQVSDVKNMLFERGLLISRPGLTVQAMATATQPYFGIFDPQASDVPRGWMKCVTSGGTQSLKRVGRDVGGGTFLVDVDVALPAGYVFSFAGTPGQYYMWQCYFRQGLTDYNILSNFQTGGGVGALVLVDGTNTATGVALPTTTITGVMVITHLSRVIAAGFSGTPRGTIFWSKIGDPTTWTGDFTAGSTTLLDVDDQPTGIDVVRNTIILARSTGFHVGVATGNGANPYDWKKLSSRDKGNFWPASLARWGNEFFFVSVDDVHRFDLSNVTDIGEGITEELFDALRVQGSDVRGVITRSYKNGGRPQYHLFTTVYGVPQPNVSKHFIYDIKEGLWSKHTYDAYVLDNPPLSYPTPLTYYNGNQLQSTLCLLRRSASQFVYWDKNVSCESVQSFTTGRIMFGDPSMEYAGVRCLVIAYCDTDDTEIVINLEWVLGNTPKGESTKVTLNQGWNRVWGNRVGVGQFFQARVEIPASVHVQFRQLVFDYETEGQELRA